MPINFHDEKNRLSYATRMADESWAKAMCAIVQPNGLRIADVGCSGGIYSRAWVDLGAREVIGIDSSQVMVDAARETSIGTPGLSFRLGDAANTTLSDKSVDLVFERALIHHLSDLPATFLEARRMLEPSGRIIIQDRTPEDVGMAPSPTHIRGYIFDRFPRLLPVDQTRRWSGWQVREALQASGFQNISEQSVWETRRVYPNFPAFAEDLRNRTGRSILHELSDDELDDLIDYIGKEVPKDEEIIERDRWTIWSATPRIE